MSTEKETKRMGVWRRMKDACLRPSKSKSDKLLPSIEEYIGAARWISLERDLEKDGKHLGDSTHFERWINYWIAADRYLRDSHVERYVECELTLKISPLLIFPDGRPPLLTIMSEMRCHVNDTDNDDNRWDTPFHKEVSYPMYYSIWYNRELRINVEKEDVIWIIPKVCEIVTEEEISYEELQTRYSFFHVMKPNIFLFPINYREKIQNAIKLLKRVNDLHKKIFTLLTEDVNIKEDYDNGKILSLTILKEKPLFDLGKWDEINDMKENRE